MTDFTSFGMKHKERSDDEVIAVVTQALGSCQPPIEFGSIEEGYFADGRRIVALINFLKQGNGVMDGNLKRNPFQIDAMLQKSRQTTARKSSVPGFKIQQITGRDKVETMNLLRWIVTVCRGRIDPGVRTLSSIHVNWKQRLGVTRPIPRQIPPVDNLHSSLLAATTQPRSVA
jgi:hypothetical protein